jgi:flagellar hook-associated protein 1
MSNNSLNIARSAVTSNLAAFQVIGHNIANVTTEGYTRQTVDMQARTGSQLGSSLNFFGQGVNVASVERQYSGFLTREAQATKAVAAGDAVHYMRLQQLEELFPMGETGMGEVINRALNAWVDVASSPTDLTARAVALTSAEDLATRLQATTSGLDELRVSSTQQFNGTLESINTLAKSIATLNAQVMQSGDEVSNDLLDQREKAITDLNKYVQTSTVADARGGLTLFVAGGQPLVLGGTAFQLKNATDPSVKNASQLAPTDPMQVAVVLDRGDGQPTALNPQMLGGGELSGLMQFVNHDLTDTQNAVGRLAMSLAVQMNEQHRLGIDLNGQAGGDLFSLQGGYVSTDATSGAVSISALPAPGATGTVAATVTDPTALKASNYELQFSDPSNGALVRLSDGLSTNFTVDPGGKLSFGTASELDGLSFAVDTTDWPAGGDRYLFKPFADVSRNIDVAVTQPASVAVASPVYASFNAVNTGSMGLESLSLSAASPSLKDVMATSLPSMEMVYDSTSGTFSVSASGAYSAQFFDKNGTPTVPPGTSPQYVPGETLHVQWGDGTNSLTYALTLRGTPADTDKLTINPVDESDPDTFTQNAGNANAMLALRDQASLDGVTLSNGYTSVFSVVANKAQAGRLAAEFSDTKAMAAENARSSQSGVNLDEEAARLLQYQQAYEAAAKYLQVIQANFDTLLSRLG